MKKLGNTLLFPLLICLSQKLSAQDSIPSMTIKMKALTTDDGLAQGFVYGGLQDKDGFVWLATPDGLNRYDGYGFKVYQHDPKDPFSLPENFASALAEDDNGNLWVGTNSKGLFLFDRIQERFYPVNLPFDSLGKLSPGIFSLKYQNQRLFIFLDKICYVADVDDVKPGHYTANDLRRGLIFLWTNKINSSQSVRSSVMPDNSIWDYESTSVTCYYPDSNFNQRTGKKFFAHDFGIDTINSFTRFYQFQNQHKLCIIDRTHLYVYDFDTRTIVFEKASKNFMAEFFGEPRAFNGKLYFNQYWDHGIYEFDLATYTIKKYVSANELSQIGNVLFCDRTGVLWLQTDAQGVLLLNTQVAAFHCPGFLGRMTWGSKTLVTLKLVNGFNEFYEFSTEANTNHVIVPQGLIPGESHWNQNEFIDHKGNLLLDEKNETLLSYNLKTKTFKRHQTTTGLNHYFFFEDHLNHPWDILHEQNGSHIYLIQLDSSYDRVLRKLLLPIPYPQKNNFIRDYYVDVDNNFWFATYSGLVRFDTKETDASKMWKHYSYNQNDSTGLSSDDLFSLCGDPREPKNYLWVGSRSTGIDRLEIATGKCIHFTMKNGLPNNVAVGMLTDNSGHIWIATNSGLSCFTPPDKNNPSGKFRNFTEEDGLAGNEFNPANAKKIVTGELLFQGVKGATWFQPEEVLKQEEAVPVHFISLSVNNKPVDLRSDSNIIAGNVAYAKNITLSHEHNIFTIGFAAMDFRKRSGIRYRYYLEGFNKLWIDAGTRNEATYTNLLPGKYVFNVIACNSDGVWNKDAASIIINIIPAWYQTWWFKVALLLAGAGAIYSIYRYRLHQNMRVLAVRDKIAGDLHDEIGSTLSSISLSSTIIQKKMEGKENEVSSLLNQISTNTDEMMEAISDIVWSINTKNDHFEQVIDRMRAFAVEMTESKNILLHFDVNEKVEQLHLDMIQRKNFYLIFKEAINNATKYAACKNMWVTISLNGNKKLSMIIKDDGKGFETGMADEKKWNEIKGGNGLDNMYRRAAEIKGQLNVDSRLNEGTTISLQFSL